MANAREIKSRIKSIKETKKITSAMKLISASKLRKSRQQLEKTQPFFQKVKEVMLDILIKTQKLEDIEFLNKRKDKKSRRAMYIVVTGDKGLAGGYNANVIKLAEKTVSKDNDILITIGALGHHYFKRYGYNIFENMCYSSQNPDVYGSREFAEAVAKEFLDSKVDDVYLIYTHMINSLNQETRMLKLLPLDVDAFNEVDFNVKRRSKFLYEPSPDVVFNILVPKYLKGVIYGALVESFTSELSSRMTAMDSATSNANKMIDKYTLSYNRARQAAITQEISEIVGGATVVV